MESPSIWVVRQNVGCSTGVFLPCPSMKAGSDSELSSARRSAGYLENQFQLDRCAEREACHTIDQAARVLLFPEDVLQQLRGSVGDLRLFAKVAHRGHRDAKSNVHASLCRAIPGVA